MAMQGVGDTKYLLFHRAVLVNAVGFVFIFVAWKAGWVRDIIALDTLYISRVILALFVFAALDCIWKIWKTSRELNIAQSYVAHLRANDTSATAAIELGKSRVAQHFFEVRGVSADGRHELDEILENDLNIGLTTVGYNIGRLAALGFIGTLVGIAVALKVFDVPLTDASQVLGLFNKVPPGLRIAVYPALLGGVAALWLDFLFQILDQGTEKLISWIKKAGVYHAQQPSA